MVEVRCVNFHVCLLGSSLGEVNASILLRPLLQVRKVFSTHIIAATCKNLRHLELTRKSTDPGLVVHNELSVLVPPTLRIDVVKLSLYTVFSVIHYESHRIAIKRPYNHLSPRTYLFLWVIVNNLRV